MTAEMIGEMTGLTAGQTGGVTDAVMMTAIAVQADTIQTAVNYHWTYAMILTRGPENLLATAIDPIEGDLYALSICLGLFSNLQRFI